MIVLRYLTWPFRIAGRWAKKPFHWVANAASDWRWLASLALLIMAFAVAVASFRLYPLAQDTNKAVEVVLVEKDKTIAALQDDVLVAEDIFNQVLGGYLDVCTKYVPTIGGACPARAFQSRDASVIRKEQEGG